MSFIVQKYGGTTLASPEKIMRVAQKIAQDRRSGHDLVVVASAMGSSTDELEGLASRVSPNPSPRELDMLLTTGERVSMSLLSMALRDLGIEAVSLTGSQSGIITTGHHTRARILRVLGDRIRDGLKRGVVIVAGFQGVSEEKEITTLGRGGSDTTAVALTMALGASRCEIYTDVAGVFSADPRVVENPRLILRIDHDQMLEFSLAGAGVLHWRAVELAKRGQVGLRVGLPGELPGELKGTEVRDLDSDFRKPRVTGVVAQPELEFVDLTLARPEGKGAFWEPVLQGELEVRHPQFEGEKIRFFRDRTQKKEWEAILGRLSNDGFIKEYQILSEFCLVSVVGGFDSDATTLYKAIEILAYSKISVNMGKISPQSVVLLVERERQEEAVRLLHRELVEKAV